MCIKRDKTEIYTHLSSVSVYSIYQFRDSNRYTDTHTHTYTVHTYIYTQRDTSVVYLYVK